MRMAVVHGCACPASVAPYAKRVLERAGQNANSIYRGADAGGLLKLLGKSTQAEIHRQFPLISNPPGFSSHELRGDGVYGTRGATLPEWSVGIDSGTDAQASRDAITRAGRELGWEVWHPYSRGVEAHHWSFRKRPRPRNPKQAYHIARERSALVKAAKGKR